MNVKIFLTQQKWTLEACETAIVGASPRSRLPVPFFFTLKENSSFTVVALEFSREGTAVPPWEYWSFPVGVLEFYRGSTAVLPWWDWSETAAGQKHTHKGMSPDTTLLFIAVLPCFL